MATNQDDLSLQLREDLERQRRTLEDARLKASQSLNQDAGRSQRVLNASLYTGLPAEVVDADLDSIESRIKTQEFDVEYYRETAPAYTKFLAENPYHMAALEKDQENLGYVERTMKQIGMGWRSTTDQLSLAHLNNTRIKQGGEFTPEQQDLYNKLQETQVNHEFGATGLASMLIKNVKMAGPTLYSATSGLQEGLATGLAFAGGAALLGQAGPQVGLPEELVTVPGAFMGGLRVGAVSGASRAAFTLERGFAYDEYRSMGMDHETALMGANTVGTINMLFETVGVGAAVKYIPVFRGARDQLAKKLTGDVLQRQSVKRATGVAIARLGEVLGTEVVTEALQESTTMIVGEVIRPDGVGHELTFEMFADRVTETMLETLQGAFILSSIGPSASYYGDIRRAQEAKRLGVAFETLNTSAKSSETRKNMPGTWKQFIQRLKDQGASDSVYVDGEVVTEYFQEQGRDADAVLLSLGVDQNDINIARDTGGDIAIPLEAFAERIAGTQAGMDLAKHLKGSADSMSVAEADLFQKNNPEIVKQMQDALEAGQESTQDAEIDQIVQDVTGQLVAAGYESNRTAGQLGQILRGIGVLARRNNQDPIELYERVFAGVRRRTPKEPDITPGDVDVMLDPLLNRLRAKDYPSQREMFGPSIIDLINDKGGINPTDPELVAMDFEKGAQDLGISQAKLKRWKEEGGTLADMSEVAAELGYIPENSENLLIDAIRDNLAGRPVFGDQDSGSAGLRDLSQKMDELAMFIDQAGLDLDTMTNQQIRAAMDARQTFLQIDTDELNMLTDMVLKMVGSYEKVQTDSDTGIMPDRADTLLAEAALMLPMISENQDFGDTKIPANVTIQETGKQAKAQVSAQREFDRAVKRKNIMKKLLDCLNA